jgi:hypothetical protein
MKKPGIPAAHGGVVDSNLQRMLVAMKENLEIITGARPQVGEIAQLSSTATTADIIAKINEIISRLNFSGN